MKDFTSHEEPFSGQEISVDDLGSPNHNQKFDNLLSQNISQFAHSLDEKAASSKARLGVEAIFEFAGRTTALYASRSMLVGLLSLTVARAMNLSYQQGWQNFSNSSSGYRSKQYDNMFSLRMKAFVIPSSIIDFVAKNFDLSFEQITAANALVSTVAMIDSPARLNAVIGRKFDLVDDKGKGVNLIEIAKDENKENFFRYAQNNMNENSAARTAKFSEKDRSQLQNQVNIYQQNKPLRVAMMSARNAIFSYATFMSIPLAKSIVGKFGEEIEQNTRIKKSEAEFILGCALFSSFAVLTTSFDRALTLLSSGKMNSEQVFNKIKEEVKKGDLKALHAGSISRVAFCFLAAGVVNKGHLIGDWALTKVDDIVDMIDEKIKGNQVKKPGPTVVNAEAKKIIIDQKERE